MAIDAYMQFFSYESTAPIGLSEIPVLLTGQPAGSVFEIDDYTLEIEQTLNIGSQSTGSGAGKITFNPFTITRRIDKLTPTLFQQACSGTPFSFVKLYLVKSGGSSSASPFLTYTFKLVAVKTIQYNAPDDDATETVSFEYGGLVMNYVPPGRGGALDSANTKSAGWNRVRNVLDTSTTAGIR